MTRSDFEHIARRLRPLMLRVALDFFGSTNDAEDVTQESMMRLWSYCERIDSERNVEGLAVRVAKNCCVSWYRRRAPLAAVPDLAGSPSDQVAGLSPSPHDLLEAKDTQAILAAALARLKPRERELFDMRQLQGFSLDEIADLTAIPKPSVKAMISAARKKLLIDLQQRLKD